MSLIRELVGKKILMIEKAFCVIEILMFFAVVIFPITAGIMIFNLKRAGFNLVGTTVKSKFSIDIDLSFFKKLRLGYREFNETSYLPFLNQISFYVLVLGFFCLLVLAIIEGLFF
jgi:hypothetical protein